MPTARNVDISTYDEDRAARDRLQVSVHDLAEAAAAFDAPLTAFGLIRTPHEQDHVPAGSRRRAAAVAQAAVELAAAVGDLDVCSDVKDPVVDLVVEVAGTWAADRGRSPEPSGAQRGSEVP